MTWRKGKGTALEGSERMTREEVPALSGEEDSAVSPLDAVWTAPPPAFSHSSWGKGFSPFRHLGRTGSVPRLQFPSSAVPTFRAGRASWE